MNSTSTRHRAGRGRLVRGIGWMAVAGMLGLALVGPGVNVAAAASVTPILIPGADNVSCSQLDDIYGNGQTWSEAKVTGIGANWDGTYPFPAGSITISNFVPSNAPTAGSFDWSSTFGIDAVLVKTGIAGKFLYVYDPPAEAFSDTNLLTPSGQGNGFSHISFCYDGTTTTTTSTSTTDTTTTDTTTTDTTTTDTTTTDTTTTDTTTTDTTTTDTTTTDTTTTDTTTTDTTTTDTTTTDTTTTDTTTTGTTTTTSTTTTATTVTTFTTTEPTEPPFPSFPTNPPTTPPTNPPTQPPTEPPTVAPTDTGGVAGVTSAPNTTPPPTSTGGTTGTPNDGTWRIALIAMAGLLATILVMTPATARRRR